MYQTTIHNVGYYAILAAWTCLNLCLVSLRLPSSSRSGDLSPNNHLPRASLGRPAIKTPVVLASIPSGSVAPLQFSALCTYVKFMMIVNFASLYELACVRCVGRCLQLRSCFVPWQMLKRKNSLFKFRVYIGSASLKTSPPMWSFLLWETECGPLTQQ